ncbi:MAG TPA: DUF2303 family protein [Reyranella sp.]|nr:DUF2303 family protein [Reyranella sp.]
MSTVTPEPVFPVTADLVKNMAVAAVAPVEIDGVCYVMVPQSYQVHDLTAAIEKARPAPSRKQGTAVLTAIDSFVQYVKDQDAAAVGYLFASVDERRITAVFNDHKASAGWRDHKASFTAELTPEAKRWLDNDKKQMPQEAFAEFIEDNFADLAGDHAPLLLEVATTIAAKTGINFSSAKRLDNGQTQFVYNEVIDATAGSNGTTQIPQTFLLGVRLFKGDTTGYAIKARLKYRLNSGALKFWYELERVERALEEAFLGYVEKATETGYTVLLGKP